MEEVVKNKPETEFDLFFDRWLTLFPKGIRTGGKLIRSDKITCKKKMQLYIKKYKHSYSDIYTATFKYITIHRKNNFQYMSCATYFISKNSESTLADEVEALKDSTNIKDLVNVSVFKDL